MTISQKAPRRVLHRQPPRAYRTTPAVENDYTVPQLYTEWTTSVSQRVRNLLPGRRPDGIPDQIALIVLEDPSDPTVKSRTVAELPSDEVLAFLDYGAWLFPVNNHQGFIFTENGAIIRNGLGVELPTQDTAELVALIDGHDVPPIPIPPPRDLRFGHLQPHLEEEARTR